ncbi:MAG: flavodoxin family protein [bacterium]
MKVTAFNGSPRKKGNTFTCLSAVLEEIEREGIETELVQLGGKDLRGCIACFRCFGKKDRRCHGRDDDMQGIIDAMLESDGILIGSPTYFGSVSAEVKAVIDRAGLVARANGFALSRKAGAAVVAVRRQGATNVFEQINRFFLINNMIVPGSTYWNLAIGLEPGDVLKDEEGMKTMRDLGRNMAWLIKKLKQPERLSSRKKT